MGKIVLFVLILIVILIYPIYENSKISVISDNNVSKNLPLVKFFKGEFFSYEPILSKEGNFKVLEVYKNKYLLFDMNVFNILKKEHFSSKQGYLKNNILHLIAFRYKNDKYSFFSDEVFYNLKTKNIKGDNFFLTSVDYNATGRKFFIDSKRDIKANNISFYLKVNK